MRILFTIHGLPPERWGGAEVYTHNVARALADRGHEVTIFTTSRALGASGATEPTHTQEGEHLSVLQAPLPPSRASENAAAQLWHTVRDRALEGHFAALLAQSAPDVIHFQHVQGMSAHFIAQAAAAPAAATTARLLTLHDFWFFCANSQLRRPGNEPCAGPSAGCRNCVDCMTLRDDLRPWRRLRELVALPLAARNRYLAARLREVDLCLAPSAFLRERYIGQGLPAARIEVLENGILADAGDAEPLALGDSRSRFLFVGSLAPHKGVHILVEAFNPLPPDARLTIIGGEGSEAGYAEQVRALSKHPGIRFAGAQSQAVVHATLREADCLVVPSLWYENSPLVVQEAFAAGVPVVASRIGALEEKVRDGLSGRLFTPGSVDELANLLRTLHADPGALAALRAGVTPPVPMAAHVNRLLAIYERLLQAKRTDA
jgi:glycosyltransferase involved in cell wall biosynthesis